LNIKEFSKAVKDKKLIIFGWDCDEGYYVVLTQKVPKQGFVHIEEKKLYLGKKLIDGALAKVYKRIKNGSEDNVWHYYLQIRGMNEDLSFKAIREAVINIRSQVHFAYNDKYYWIAHFNEGVHFTDDEGNSQLFKDAQSLFDHATIEGKKYINKAVAVVPIKGGLYFPQQRKRVFEIIFNKPLQSKDNNRRQISSFILNVK